MPQDKDVKRLVRARMAETGERYTQAKAAIDTRSPSADIDPRWRQWIDALGANEARPAAYHRLKALPDDVLRQLAVAGTTREEWHIRRACCQLLDDLAFTPESLAALERCLDDHDARVRRAALHSLSCQHCKPEGCVVDARSVFERMASDPNRSVRKMVVTTLWVWDSEEWVESLLGRIADHDPSGYLRDLARSSLESMQRARSSDAERRMLPPELVAKTERHRGKWVAISDGRIVGAGRFHALSRRQRRALRPDIQEYWVAPHD